MGLGGVIQGNESESLVRVPLAHKGDLGHGDGQGPKRRRGAPPPAQSGDRQERPARQSRQAAASSQWTSGYGPLRRERQKQLYTLHTGDGRLPARADPVYGFMN
jgi:hypothetical protein